MSDISDDVPSYTESGDELGIQVASILGSIRYHGGKAAVYFCDGNFFAAPLNATVNNKAEFVGVYTKSITPRALRDELSFVFNRWQQ